MKALFFLFVLGIILLAGCKPKAELPDKTVLEGINTNTGQDVLDENLSDVDQALSTISGDATAEVNSAVTSQELTGLDQSAAELNNLQADLDPTQFNIDTTI
ncbi:MAG: hypothetical protein AABX51_02540 [Nanoarchaeota archaeon]